MSLAFWKHVIASGVRASQRAYRTGRPSKAQATALQTPFSEAQVDRWDREWLIYLNQEDPAPHLVKARALHPRGSLSGLSRRDVFRTASTTRDGVDQPALRIWADGDWLVGKSVMEFGCGTGFVGKNVGHLVQRFLGIDVSDLAIAIANAGKPSTATFVHVRELPMLTDLHACFDTWVAREFFIHQNLAMVRETLRRGLPFVKPGGRLCADFFAARDPSVAGVHAARRQLDTAAASRGYVFSNDDVDAIAKEFGLAIEEQVVVEDEQRRFVVFLKT